MITVHPCAPSIPDVTGRCVKWVGPKDAPAKRLVRGLVTANPRMEFVGDVVVELLTHPGADLLVRVVQPFTFFDRNGMPWPVPFGVIADGASIPGLLQWLAGHPLEGDYRRAALVHDPYCGVPQKALRVMAAASYAATRIERERSRIAIAGASAASVSRYENLTAKLEDLRALRDKLAEGVRVAETIAKTRSDRDTHRVFHDACVTDELSRMRAWGYYQLVDNFGPQWGIGRAS